MNRLKLLLALSVALNAGFITLLLLHTASNGGPREARPQASPLFTPTLPDQALLEKAAGDGPVEPPPATIEGYRRLLLALRATGLPEREVHRVLRGAAVADWQDDVRRMQQARPGSDEFWKARNTPFGIDISSQRQAVELRRAREAALSELIGDRDSPDPWSLSLGPARRGIPPHKRKAVIMLEEDYELLMADTYLRTGGNPLPEDLEAMRLLQQERLDDLANILSTDQLEEYQLRHSETADSLRYNLKFFDATEEEFRALFRLRHALETEFPLLAASPEERQQRQIAEETARAELRSLLGEERFADYQRVQDPDFQHLAGLTERLGIPQEKAEEVYDFRSLAEEQRQEILDDPELTLEDKAEAIQLLASEARKVVGDALGQHGYKAYSENGGWWLHRLEQDLPPES